MSNPVIRYTCGKCGRDHTSKSKIGKAHKDHESSSVVVFKSDALMIPLPKRVRLLTSIL